MAPTPLADEAQTFNLVKPDRYRTGLLKTCSKCREEKPLTDFNKHKAKADGLQPVCKHCACEISKSWYRDNKNKPEVRKRYTSYNADLVAALKKEVDDYKATNGCLICGEQDPCVLDFHHPHDKDVEVSYVRRTKNRKRLYQEIAKCVVLCSNCHRKLHAGRFQLIARHGCHDKERILA